MNNTNANIKRRIVKRHAARVDVYLLTNKGYHKCKTRDISRGGVFIETDYRGFYGGDDVQVVFVQPHEVKGVVRLRRYQTRVIHRTFNGLGLKFINIRVVK